MARAPGPKRRVDPIANLPTEATAGQRHEALSRVDAAKTIASLERSGFSPPIPRLWDVSRAATVPCMSSESASEQISQKIAALGDWRGDTLNRIRTLIHEADPDIVEEWKWRGTPVWSHDGIVCTGETYKNVVKMTFAKGAALADPKGLFNASLDGNVRRAIDIHEGEAIDGEALKKLIRAAVALNVAKKKPSSRPRKK